MITTDVGLQVSREALGNLQRALAHLESEKHRYHPKNYPVFEEPILDEIQKIQAQIDEYLQRKQSGAVRVAGTEEPTLSPR